MSQSKPQGRIMQDPILGGEESLSRLLLQRQQEAWTILREESTAVAAATGRAASPRGGGGGGGDKGPQRTVKFAMPSPTSPITATTCGGRGRANTNNNNNNNNNGEASSAFRELNRSIDDYLQRVVACSHINNVSGGGSGEGDNAVSLHDAFSNLSRFVRTYFDQEDCLRSIADFEEGQASAVAAKKKAGGSGGDGVSSLLNALTEDAIEMTAQKTILSSASVVRDKRSIWTMTSQGGGGGTTHAAVVPSLALIMVLCGTVYRQLSASVPLARHASGVQKLLVKACADVFSSIFVLDDADSVTARLESLFQIKMAIVEADGDGDADGDEDNSEDVDTAAIPPSLRSSMEASSYTSSSAAGNNEKKGTRKRITKEELGRLAMAPAPSVEQQLQRTITSMFEVPSSSTGGGGGGHLPPQRSSLTSSDSVHQKGSELVRCVAPCPTYQDLLTAHLMHYPQQHRMQEARWRQAQAGGCWWRVISRDWKKLNVRLVFNAWRKVAHAEVERNDALMEMHRNLVLAQQTADDKSRIAKQAQARLVELQSHYERERHETARERELERSEMYVLRGKTREQAEQIQILSQRLEESEAKRMFFASELERREAKLKHFFHQSRYLSQPGGGGGGAPRSNPASVSGGVGGAGGGGGAVPIFNFHEPEPLLYDAHDHNYNGDVLFEGAAELLEEFTSHMASISRDAFQLGVVSQPREQPLHAAVNDGELSVSSVDRLQPNENNNKALGNDCNSVQIKVDTFEELLYLTMTRQTERLGGLEDLREELVRARLAAAAEVQRAGGNVINNGQPLTPQPPHRSGGGGGGGARLASTHSSPRITASLQQRRLESPTSTTARATATTTVQQSGEKRQHTVALHLSSSALIQKRVSSGKDLQASSTLSSSSSRRKESFVVDHFNEQSVRSALNDSVDDHLGSTGRVSGAATPVRVSSATPPLSSTTTMAAMSVRGDDIHVLQRRIVEAAAHDNQNNLPKWIRLLALVLQDDEALSEDLLVAADVVGYGKDPSSSSPSTSSSSPQQQHHNSRTTTPSDPSLEPMGAQRRRQREPSSTHAYAMDNDEDDSDMDGEDVDEELSDADRASKRLHRAIQRRVLSGALVDPNQGGYSLSRIATTTAAANMPSPMQHHHHNARGTAASSPVMNAATVAKYLRVLQELLCDTSVVRLGNNSVSSTSVVAATAAAATAGDASNNTDHRNSRGGGGGGGGGITSTLMPAFCVPREEPTRLHQLRTAVREAWYRSAAVQTLSRRLISGLFQQLAVGGLVHAPAAGGGDHLSPAAHPQRRHGAGASTDKFTSTKSGAQTPSKNQRLTRPTNSPSPRTPPTPHLMTQQQLQQSQASMELKSTVSSRRESFKSVK